MVSIMYVDIICTAEVSLRYMILDLESYRNHRIRVLAFVETPTVYCIKAHAKHKDPADQKVQHPPLVEAKVQHAGMFTLFFGPPYEPPCILLAANVYTQIILSRKQNYIHQARIKALAHVCHGQNSVRPHYQDST